MHKWRRSTHSRKCRPGGVGGGVEDHRSLPFAEPLIERRHCRRRPTNHALVGRPVNGGDGGRKKNNNIILCVLLSTLYEFVKPPSRFLAIGRIFIFSRVVNFLKLRRLAIDAD